MAYNDNGNQPLLSETGSINSSSYKQNSRKNLLNVVQLGLSFCLLFIAFNTAQSFEANANHNLGLLSLSVLYIVFSLSNLVAGAIVKRTGEKISLFFGGLGYVLYLASNVYPRYYTMIPGAVLIGFGASILWTAQGSFMAKSSTEATLGYYSGVFFALFQLNAVIGNIMAALLLMFGKSLHVVFIVLVICGAAADCSFWLLRNPKANTQIAAKDVNLGETLGMFKQPKMLMMIPVLVYSGFSQSFFYSKWTTKMDVQLVGFVMATFGASDTLSSVILGRLSDRIGKKPVLIFSTICALFAYLLTAEFFVKLEHHYIFFVIAIFLGLSDGGYNTQLYSVIGYFQPTSLEAAYAFLKGIQSTASAIAFGYSLVWDLYQISLCMLISLGVSIVFFLLCDFFVERVDPKKRNDAE